MGNEGKGGRHGTVPGWKRSAWAESPASSDRDHADAPSELAIVQIVVSQEVETANKNAFRRSPHLPGSEALLCAHPLLDA